MESVLTTWKQVLPLILKIEKAGALNMRLPLYPFFI